MQVSGLAVYLGIRYPEGRVSGGGGVPPRPMATAKVGT